MSIEATSRRIREQVPFPSAHGIDAEITDQQVPIKQVCKNAHKGTSIYYEGIGEGIIDDSPG
jgi:hypothetical protein